ncbi:MAG: DNA gyrase subunit A [Oscillospiraceae bacterium]|nr:DNA gyrase subunit A [Oscillospiraceae bacterium]
MEKDRVIIENEKILEVDIEKEIKKSFLDYSMSVIVSRALPDVRDGLKPVHRRILYSMEKNGLTHDKPTRKSANIVGNVLAEFHPHGDASVYDAMVRLAQLFSMRYPLIEGQGNFGSVDGDPPAAYRYTEARMSRICELMLRDIDKETVDFVPNYDDTSKEPVALPSRIPNLLVNGSTGIAVGMATNIPPHNLREVCNAVDYLIDNPDCGALDLMDYISGPDFPTGGIIMGRAGIRAAYATGRGKIILRGRAEIEELKNGRMRIVITEIPYMVNKARLIESIANLVKDKRVDGIVDLVDASDRDGMRILIDLRRDANAQVVLNRLYQYTQLQDTVGVIMLALKNGEPKIMDLKTILQSYVDFQKEVIRRRTEFDLRKAQERAHILEGLARAVDIVDEIIAAIRACKGGVPEAKAAVMEQFGFDDPQATAIVAFRLGQLAGLEILKIENELNALHERIADLEDVLNNEHHLVSIVKQENDEVREKYGDERRTEIAAVSGEVDIEDLIPEEDCVVTLTHFGYVKRQPTDVYKSQKRGGRGIQGLTRRDEDFVEELFITSSHDYLLFMTSMGRVYKMKAYEIPESSRAARGVNIVNLLPLLPDEKVSSVIRVSDFDDAEYIVMVTRAGVIKRSALSLYANIRKTGVYGISLDEGDELAWARLTDGNCDLVVATKKGMAIRFCESNARPMGRTARGVKAITLRPGDEVVGMATVREGARLLTVTDAGKGRLTNTEDYRLQRRGGMGIKNYDCKNGATVIGVKAIDDGDDAILISQNGVIIRMHAEDIAVQSRYGGGVRVMRLGGDDCVVTVARAERSEDEETEKPETLTAEELAAEQAAAAADAQAAETAEIEAETDDLDDLDEEEVPGENAPEDGE